MELRMKRYKIVNRKKFLLFLCIFSVLTTGFLYGLYLFSKNLIGNRQKSEQIEVVQDKNQSGASALDDTSSSQQKSNTLVKDAETEKKVVTEYENQSYGYLVSFPDGWFINNDDSEAKIVKNENEDGQILMNGGQTFWSNYPDINKFTPQDKPEDFRLLGLTIYEDESLTMDDFAQRIGALEDAKKEEFQAVNVQGIQYVSPGVMDKNPRITIIFKKDKLFYVFKPAFINGDAAASDDMEAIVKSFTIR